MESIEQAEPVVLGPRGGRAKRRSFTSEYKAQVVAEYDAAPSGSKGVILRRERLYDSHISEWRAQVRAAAMGETPPSRGRPKSSPEQARVVELERQVKRLEADLARKDSELADRDAALDVLGKGVAFLEALSSRNAR